MGGSPGMSRRQWRSLVHVVLAVHVLGQAYGQIKDELIPKHCCNGSVHMTCSTHEQDVTLLHNGQSQYQPQQAISPVEFYTDALLPDQTQPRSVRVRWFNAQLRAKNFTELFVITGTAVEIQGCISTVVKRPFSVWAEPHFLNAPEQFTSGCMYQVTQCPGSATALQEPEGLTPIELEPVPESTRQTESGGDVHFRIVDPLSAAELQNVRYQLAITGTVLNGSGAADMVLPLSGVGILINQTDFIVTIPTASAPQTVRALVKFRKVTTLLGRPWQGLPSEYYLQLNAPGMQGTASTDPASVSTSTAASPSSNSTHTSSGGTTNGSDPPLALIFSLAFLAAVVVITLLCFLGWKIRSKRAAWALAGLDVGAHERPPVNVLAIVPRPTEQSEPPPPYILEERTPPESRTSPPPTPSPQQAPLPKDIQSNNPSGPATNQEAASAGARSTRTPIAVQETHKHPEDFAQGSTQEQGTVGGAEMVPGAGPTKLDPSDAPIVTGTSV